MTVQAVLFFWIIHQKRCHTDITCSQKPKNNSFLFLKKTTILLQFYYNESDLFSKLYVTVYDSILTYLLTYYLKVLTYFWFLFSFFVFSLFLFSFFFVKNQIQTTFFCKKILRTFLPPPNECYVVFLISKHLKKKKRSTKNPKQTSNQQPINNF